MAARLVGAPVALVSLIDADRQIFASTVRLDEPLATERQTPLSQSWCRHVVTTNAPLIIEDAAADLGCDRLRELDRMKDELVAVVSHELCNPIATFAVTPRCCSTPTLTTNHAASRRSSIGAVRPRDLVDDLLDLARLDAGHLAIAPRSTSLGRIIRQAVDDHRHCADA